ncbi:hypothetical protein BKA70DRAFT_1279011 [Coprinopsis sp. MPI-PUGE-AT-0042]|nr:hypothetical protein BKA70DRAFT_1279011 [Coprinopsis sp. MPI-PUGE-AT-0042]
MASSQEDIVLLLRTSYAGVLIMTAGQTYQLLLCIQTFRQAQKTPRRLRAPRKPYLLLMLAIMVSSVVAFIVDVLDKGALFTPGEAITSETVLPPDPLWWHIASPLAIGFIHLVGDGLLAWRTYLLWNSRPFLRFIPLVPYIASFGVLIAHIAITSKWALDPVDSGLLLVIQIQSAYFITSVSVNLVATGLICFRLLSFKKRVEKALGEYRLKSEVPYLGISAILIESALPYTIFGLACTVLTALAGVEEIYAATHAAYHLLWPMWVISCALAPQLIIARVLNGSSWVSDPTKRMEDIELSLDFAAAPGSRRTNCDFPSDTRSTPEPSHPSTLELGKMDGMTVIKRESSHA